jgi:topoisomerase-4 subunit A
LEIVSPNPVPPLNVIFGGHDSFREAQIIEASDFVGVKSFKAKGKRLTTYSVDRIEELEPTRMPEPEILEEDDDNDSVDTNVPEEEEENGQMKLF